MTNAFILSRVRAVTDDTVLENASVWVENGLIRRVFSADEQLPPETQNLPRTDGKNAYAFPGFIDLHIHGFSGFGPETGTPEALWQMSEALARQGVTAFCPTLYCAKPADMEALLRKLSPAVGHEKGAKILGFHLEGPFISPQKPGVMKPQDIAPADLDVLKCLYKAADGKIAAMTLAPELPDIKPIIDFCLEYGILPQAGHTNASYGEFLAAARYGVTHATHLFNAMSPFNHRAPGAAGAVLFHPEISCEIIADGVHVHPDAVAFLRRIKPVKNIVLVTDALKPTGQTSGPFTANGEEVIFDGGVWKRKKDGVIAGSALTLARGVKNLVDVGFSLPEAAQCASSNPARLMGLKGTGKLAAGFTADITLLDENFEPAGTFIGGNYFLHALRR